MSEIAYNFYIDRKKDVISNYYQQTLETEKYRKKETDASVRIQSIFRMFRLRTKYLVEKHSINLIKRIFLGFRTRKLFWLNLAKSITSKQLKYYSYQATSIQRIYRGYYCRRYKHDFYARKKYLQHIQSKNQKRLQKMDEYRLQLDADNQQRQEDYARLEFYKLADSLHHLTSTKAITGVYSNLEAVSNFGKISSRPK